MVLAVPLAPLGLLVPMAHADHDGDDVACAAQMVRVARVVPTQLLGRSNVGHNSHTPSAASSASADRGHPTPGRQVRLAPQGQVLAHCHASAHRARPALRTFHCRP
jgi:hypothetical protein